MILPKIGNQILLSAEEKVREAGGYDATTNRFSQDMIAAEIDSYLLFERKECCRDLCIWCRLDVPITEREFVSPSGNNRSWCFTHQKDGGIEYPCAATALRNRWNRG